MYLWGASVGSQLNINNPYAIGTGTFTINSGNAAVMDNTSGGAITLADTNAQAWNNDFAFAGSSSLNMGAGTVSLGGGRNVTVSNNTLTVGPVTDNGSGYGLNKLGAGTLTLNGGGSYTGATTISGGTLALIGSGLSSPTINIASNATLDVSALSGGATLVSGGTLNGSGGHGQPHFQRRRFGGLRFEQLDGDWRRDQRFNRCGWRVEYRRVNHRGHQRPGHHRWDVHPDPIRLLRRQSGEHHSPVRLCPDQQHRRQCHSTGCHPQPGQPDLAGRRRLGYVGY